MENTEYTIHPAIAAIYKSCNDLGFSVNESDAHDIWNAVKTSIKHYEVRDAAQKVLDLRFEGTNDNTQLYQAICELEKNMLTK